jgi:hypothetical protein
VASDMWSWGFIPNFWHHNPGSSLSLAKVGRGVCQTTRTTNSIISHDFTLTETVEIGVDSQF